MKIRFCNFEKFVGTGGRFFTKKSVFFVNSHHRHKKVTRILRKKCPISRIFTEWFLTLRAKSIIATVSYQHTRPEEPLWS